jgi:hypothetical protein
MKNSSSNKRGSIVISIEKLTSSGKEVQKIDKKKKKRGRRRGPGLIRRLTLPLQRPNQWVVVAAEAAALVALLVHFE